MMAYGERAKKQLARCFFTTPAKLDIWISLLPPRNPQYPSTFWKSKNSNQIQYLL